MRKFYAVLHLLLVLVLVLVSAVRVRSGAGASGRRRRGTGRRTTCGACGGCGTRWGAAVGVGLRERVGGGVRVLVRGGVVLEPAGEPRDRADAPVHVAVGPRPLRPAVLPRRHHPRPLLQRPLGAHPPRPLLLAPLPRHPRPLLQLPLGAHPHRPLRLPLPQQPPPRLQPPLRLRPGLLARLDRLKTLDLSDNSLSGPVPPALASAFGASAFAGNPALCVDSSRCGAGGRSLTRTSLIIIVAAGVFGAAASLLLAYAVWRWCFSPSKKSRKRAGAGAGAAGEEDGRWWAETLRASHNRLLPVSLFQKPIVKLKLADLMAATADFHPDHIVAAGSSRVGTSYKAVLRDGSALTVKRLHSCPLPEKPFRAEMGRIGQLRHPNLVPLLGFCVVEDERLLVYKHMLRIGVGAARGLAWLHHGFQIPFLHQNVSSGAVLLDDDGEARVTDFGLARLVRAAPPHEAAANTSPFLSGDFGELGYVAPEYATNPIATTKGDVYAFGVVLLELATGQKPAQVSSEAAGEDFKGNLVDWINQLAAAGRLTDAIDKSLHGKGHDEEIVEFLKIACGCIVARPKERFSMYRVYQSLKDVGDGYDFSEQFDEFPLAYGKDDSDTQ
uniref:Protein kinase domain-containing protein n=1 Tax=Ananas comosus var. bracteatus TaxID=296719 RepID=A0A6V7NN55_ANACO|nr:unnamed protein product [Ananas comosus var. bracteatus]